MFSAAKFKDVCDGICDRLARNAEDADAFEMLHSAEFAYTCAWMGLDPETTADHLARTARERRRARLGA